jgi:hypothetical protein
MHYEETFSGQVCAVYNHLVIPRTHVHPTDWQFGLYLSQLLLGAYHHWSMHSRAQDHSTKVTTHLLSVFCIARLNNLATVFQELHLLTFERELAWGTVFKLRYGISVLVKRVYYHLHGTVLSDRLS